MVSSTRAWKNSINNKPPAAMPPTVLDGVIDIKVLNNIHYFLGQSSLDDDLALAAWVKEHYLFEPTNIEGRDIRTAEGFFHLERAWRRVRALTNKAQDKWPFFQSTWKKMTSTMVRKNAQGADTGVSLPSMTSATRDQATGKEQIAPTENNSASTPGLGATSARSTRQTRRKAQSAKSSTGAPTAPPPVKKEIKSDAATPFTASQVPKSEIMQPPTVPALVPVQPSEAAKLRPAEIPPAAGGKKRGRNVRYLIKQDDDLPGDEEQIESIKKAKTHHTFTEKVKSDGNALPDIAKAVEEAIVDTSSAPPATKESTATSVATKEISSTTPATKESISKHLATKESISTPPATNQSTSTPPDTKNNTSAPPARRKSTSNDSDRPKDDITDTQEDSMSANMSAILLEQSITSPVDAVLSGEQPARSVRDYEPAWKEPPVLKTNLDRLPSNSLLAKKRKSEGRAEEGPRPKRSRTQSSKESSKTPGPDDAVGMSTRRKTRQNAAKKTASPEPSNPGQGEATKALISVDDDLTTAGKATTPQGSESGQEETTEQFQAYVSEATDQATSRKPASLQSSTPEEANAAEDLQALVASPTVSSRDGSSLSADLNTVRSLLRGDDKVSGLVPGKVEYVARVYTKKGHMDIPVSVEDFTDDVEVIQKYAVWVQDQSAPISYQDFKSSFGYQAQG